MQGIKHMVECHCVLPQYRHIPNQYHQFVVFSMIDDSDTVIPKHARCNNCGVIHNITDICKSEILMGQETGAIIDKKDIELMIPSSVSNILNTYDCDISTWELVLFYIEHQMYGTQVILTKDQSEDGNITGKILKLNGPNQFRLEPYINRRIAG